jgi:quinol monooxygenase YgiN
MDTLVLVERHARPGQEESLLAEMQRLGSGGALRREAGRSVRLFVDTAAPTHIFTVARWTTRAAYEAIVPGDPAVQAFDALCLGPPRRWFFEPLFLYRVHSRDPAVMGCALIEARPTESTRIRDLLIQLREPLLDAPDLLLHTLAQEQDAPQLFLAMHGWTSLAALEEFRRTSPQTPRNRLLAAGVQSIQEFTGYVRGDFAPDPAALLGA